MSGSQTDLHHNLGAFLRDQCGSLKEAFNVLGSGSATLSQGSFTAGLKKLGHPGPTQGVFEEMDTRSSGAITLRDFIVYFTAQDWVGLRSTPGSVRMTFQGPSKQDDDGNVGSKNPSSAIRSPASSPKSGLTEVGSPGSRTRQTRANSGELWHSRVNEGMREMGDLQESFKAQLDALQQEFDSHRALQKSQHTALVQAMQERPLVIDIKQIVRSEVEQSSVASVATDMQGDVSYVGKYVRAEVERAMSQVQLELEGHMEKSITEKSELEGHIDKSINEKSEAMSQVQLELEGRMDKSINEKSEAVKSALAQLFIDTQLTLLSEVTARMDAGSATLDERVATFEAKTIENFGQLSTTLVDIGLSKFVIGKENQIINAEVDAAVSKFDIKLENRLTDIEASMLELVGDEALQKRFLPFFQAQQLEARDDLSQLPSVLEKLQANIALQDEKLQLFAERVMSTLQGVMSADVKSTITPPASSLGLTWLETASSSGLQFPEPTLEQPSPDASVQSGHLSLATGATSTPTAGSRLLSGALDGADAPLASPVLTKSNIHETIMALSQDLSASLCISSSRGESPDSLQQSRQVVPLVSDVVNAEGDRCIPRAAAANQVRVLDFQGTKVEFPQKSFGSSPSGSRVLTRSMSHPKIQASQAPSSTSLRDKLPHSMSEASLATVELSKSLAPPTRQSSPLVEQQSISRRPPWAGLPVASRPGCSSPGRQASLTAPLGVVRAATSPTPAARPPMVQCSSPGRQASLTAPLGVLRRATSPTPAVRPLKQQQQPRDRSPTGGIRVRAPTMDRGRAMTPITVGGPQLGVVGKPVPAAYPMQGSATPACVVHVRSATTSPSRTDDADRRA